MSGNNLNRPPITAQYFNKMADGDEKVRLQTKDADPAQSLIQSDPADPKSSTKGSSEGRLTGTLLFAVIASTFGGSFQFGYNIGCMNAPEKLITSWYKDSYLALYNETMTDDQVVVAWSLSVGIFAVGGMFGGVLSGWLADKFGRKGALLINNVLALIGAILMTGAKFVNVYYLITIGRFVIGLNSGLNSGLVPMYVTEITPQNLRGSMGSVCQLQVTIAILVSQILGLPYLLGNEERWPMIFAFILVPVLIILICLPLCPESPKYNLIVKGKKDQAEKDLLRLRGVSNVSSELDAIDEEATAARSQPKVTFTDMFGASLRWPLFIAIMLMLVQQFSGINAAMYYSTKIFEQAGLPGNGPIYATIAMGAINVAQTLVSVWLVDHPKCGRRFLLLIGLFGMFVSSVLISVSLTLVNQKTDLNEQKYPWASYSAILFVLLFVVAFATGPGSIPWFFVSEIFPSSARGNANSLACMSNWVANFFVASFFAPINNVLGQYTFLIFASILAFGIAFTYKFVPETKNKTVEEINQVMYKNRPAKNAA